MVLVSIVGDFYSSILPIFYEFKDKITKHIIIHDDFKNDVVYARKIINGTCNFIDKYNLNIKSLVIKMDEDSFGGLTKVNALIDEHSQNYEDLYINITDGLANVGVILSDEFRAKGANILTYDRYDNEYNLLTLNSMKNYKMQTSIPIKDHLLLKDVEITKLQDMSFAQKYEKSLNIFFEKYEADRLLYIASDEEEKALGTKPTGFLYEYYIYNLIKELGFDDILLGVKVKDKRLDGIYLENEYDILMMKNNHLHMIECKYLKTLDTTALLYKLDSVRESLDEDANILIVTDEDDYNQTANLTNAEITQTFKRAFAKKIFTRGSPTKNIKLFMQEVDNAFGLETKNIDAIYTKKSSYSSIKAPIREKMREEIAQYLRDTLTLNIDFFDSKELVKLLQYKTNKHLSHKTKEAMYNSSLRNLIKLINKMLRSKQEYISIYEVYEFYEENLKSKSNSKESIS